jgi:hypothetical protein
MPVTRALPPFWIFCAAFDLIHSAVPHLKVQYLADRDNISTDLTKMRYDFLRLLLRRLVLECGAL